MGIGITELALLLVIVLVLFGTKRLRNMGGDLGAAIKGFRSAMNEPEKEPDNTAIEGETVKDKKDSTGNV